MDHVNLGSTGLKVSPLCLGMMSYGDPTKHRAWVLPEAEAEPLVRRAVDAGITFFDTADVYSLGASEEVTGRLLSRVFTRREDYVLATKVFFPVGDGPNDRGLSRRHIMAAIDDSLRRLGTDYVDLYQIHRFDYETPIEETMAALADVVRSGKVRYIGASSMYAWQFAKMQHVADLQGGPRFVTMQNHYNLLYREEEREMNPYCLEEGVGLLPWSPLARGLLARAGRAEGTSRAESDGLIGRFYGDPDAAVLAGLAEVAEELGRPPAQVALAWLSSKPAVVAPIVGATKPHHIDDAVAALDLDLTDKQVSRLEEPYRPRAVSGHS